MEIRTLAQAVLFGTRLEDKLVASSELTDQRPGPALETPPTAPGRPAELRLDQGRPRARFPSDGRLIEPSARGRALHFFANHELLAMELMALVLLRFPDAPKPFRRGVAHTLLEEQDHLRRYQARMNTLGVGLGDVPVSDFFWSTMANMSTPLDYVVRMSMTFEQANLDHALHYARLFRAVEDHDTADLMELVYREELGHVRHGVTWFNEWRTESAPSPSETDWDAYCRLLPAPLSARRARGHPYALEARSQVGLSDTFAQELEIYSRTRGRPPRLWVFEPDFEAQVDPSYTRPASRIDRVIAHDLAPVMMYVAASDDIVATPQRPTTAMLTRLVRSGFEIPELCTKPLTDLSTLVSERPVTDIEGWGPTTMTAKLRAAANLPARAAAPPDASSKLWARGLLDELRASADPVDSAWATLMGPAVADGRECASPDAVEAARIEMVASGFDTLLIKRPFSTSGQGRRRYSTAHPVADAWVNTALAMGPVLVEPWLDRRSDISVLLDVTDDDATGGPRPRVCAMPFLTSHHGMYRGHVLADPTFGLPEPLQQKLAFGVDGGFATRLAHLGAFVRHRLARLGHRGPAAFDLMVYRPPAHHRPQDWAVLPIVEINARRTMGHVAAALRTHLAPGRFAAWLHRPRQSNDAGRVAEWPAMTTRASGKRVQLVRGLLATTDPATARQVWSFLAVGDDPNDVARLIESQLDCEAARPLVKRQHRNDSDQA